MSDEVKITTVGINLGGVDHLLEIEQARELLQQLKRLFGENQKPLVIKEREYVPMPRQPWITWQEPNLPAQPVRYDGAPIITCRGDRSNATAMLSVTP